MKSKITLFKAALSTGLLLIGLTKASASIDPTVNRDPNLIATATEAPASSNKKPTPPPPPPPDDEEDDDSTNSPSGVPCVILN